MNPLTRLLGGLVAAAIAVLSFVFFATVGLVLVGILAVVLFVGALALRGKGQETRVGNFRVITFGGPAPKQQNPSSQSPKASALEDCVDIPPEDYTTKDDKR